MTPLIMAIAGFAAGFALDEAIAFLAREPYERGELDDDDLRLKRDGAAPLELRSESGALTMPRALTTGSAYRRVGVVAATALLFALIGLRYDEPSHLAVLALYTAVFIVCSATDVLAYRVPNVVTYPAIVGALAIGMLMPDVERTDVLAGGLLTGVTFLLMAIVTRGGMGMGDVKLALFAGFALGLELGLGALLITAITGGAAAVVLLLARVRGRRDPIPYAPFISAGAVYVMLMLGTPFETL